MSAEVVQLTQPALSFDQHARVVEAIEQRHRADLNSLEMKLVLYRQALEDAGLEPPTADGEDLLRMWRTCAAVISTTSNFVAELGTAKELIGRRLGAKL